MFLAPNLRNLCIRFRSQCFRFAQRRKQPPCELGEQLYASSGNPYTTLFNGRKLAVL